MIFARTTCAISSFLSLKNFILTSPKKVFGNGKLKRIKGLNFAEAHTPLSGNGKAIIHHAAKTITF